MNPKPRKLDPLQACFVPSCKNIVLMCPDKHFFYVPKSTRVQWCVAVNKQNVPKNQLYICEDHLNLEEDLLNYNDWIRGNVTRPRLQLLPNKLKNIGCRSSMISPLPCSSLIDNQSKTIQEKGVLCIPESHTKSVQVQPVMLDKSKSVRKHLKRKVEKDIHVGSKFKVLKYSEEQHPLSVGSTTNFTDTETSSLQPLEKNLDGRSFIIKLIENNPLGYIGLAKRHYWIVDHIAQAIKIPTLHILVTLYKIKNNDTFARIKDLFQLSISTVWIMFFKTLQLLSLFFKRFVYWPTLYLYNINRNKYPAFTTCKEYASVQSIIYCFEVEIEKPRKPIDQSLTWSEYRHCNTIKYLIGATPDGFINFISEGYGGCIADLYLVEQSGFLETVPENASILADRGFKHLESHLIKKSVKVLRLPSVLKDTKMTKSEVIESKVLASLSIHIERVIKRVCLFKFLKPHSVVNNKLVTVLDEATTIACGLINLQYSIK